MSTTALQVDGLPGVQRSFIPKDATVAVRPNVGELTSLTVIGLPGVVQSFIAKDPTASLRPDVGVLTSLTVMGLPGVTRSFSSRYENVIFPVTEATLGVDGVEVDTDLEVLFDFASIAVSGQAVEFIAGSLPVSPASLTLVGSSVQTLATTTISVSVAGISVSGQSVSLESQGYLLAETASLTSVGRTISIARYFPFSAASTGLSGKDIILGPVTQAISPSEIGATGQSIGFSFDFPVTRRATTISGRQVALATDGSISVDPVEAFLEGQSVSLTREGVVSAASVTSSGQPLYGYFTFPLSPASVTTTNNEIFFTEWDVEATEERTILIRSAGRTVEIDSGGRIIYVGPRNRRVEI